MEVRTPVGVRVRVREQCALSHSLTTRLTLHTRLLTRLLTGLLTRLLTRLRLTFSAARLIQRLFVLKKRCLEMSWKAFSSSSGHFHSKQRLLEWYPK